MSCDSTSGKSGLRPCAFGLAVGVFKGLWLLGLALSAMYFGMGAAMVEHVGSFYHGYDASFMGGIYGAVYGLVGGFISGYIFAWLYNKFLCYGCGKS